MSSAFILSIMSILSNQAWINRRRSSSLTEPDNPLPATRVSFAGRFVLPSIGDSATFAFKIVVNPLGGRAIGFAVTVMLPRPIPYG